MRRDHDLPASYEETLATAASPEEVAAYCHRALRLMETHALEAGLEELAFLLGVAPVRPRGDGHPADRPPPADNMPLTVGGGGTRPSRAFPPGRRRLCPFARPQAGAEER